MVVRRADAGREGAVVVATKGRVVAGIHRGEGATTAVQCEIRPVTCGYAGRPHVRSGRPRGPETTASYSTFLDNPVAAATSAVTSLSRSPAATLSRIPAT